MLEGGKRAWVFVVWSGGIGVLVMIEEKGWVEAGWRVRAHRCNNRGVAVGSWGVCIGVVGGKGGGWNVWLGLGRKTERGKGQ